LFANAQQKKPFVLGTIETIQSVELSENRTLNIYLPEGYSADSAATYPVIYLLDGSADEDFIHISGLVQFLNFPWVNVLPKSIVVGIANVDRKRDFTFKTANKKDLAIMPTAGGAAKFIKFIQNELQPYIEKHYKANSKKTIIGESLGGLLATEILVEHPTLFTDYIIISPSLWYDDESLITRVATLLPITKAEHLKVYISVGNEGTQMQNDVDSLVSIIKKVNDKKIKLFYYPFPKENHATIMHRSVYKAFEVMNKKE
jgi:predicted alpha/beta superfamily hydrolase